MVGRPGLTYPYPRANGPYVVFVLGIAISMVVKGSYIDRAYDRGNVGFDQSKIAIPIIIDPLDISSGKVIELAIRDFDTGTERIFPRGIPRLIKAIKGFSLPGPNVAVNGNVPNIEIREIHRCVGQS